MTVDKMWRSALKEFPVLPADAQLLSESPLDSGRRVYASGDLIYKIVLHERQVTARYRTRDFAGERLVMDSLAGVRGVPRCIALENYERGAVLVMERVDGVPIARAGSILRAMLSLPALLRLMARLSRRGVVHGDVTPDNVLVDRNGGLWLIDFDQAYMTTPRRAAIGNFFGGRIDGRQIETSIFGFARRLLKRVLPPAMLAQLRRMRHGVDALDYRTIPPIASLPRGASERLRTLYRAWLAGAASDANSPGAGVCYYSLELEGFQLPGERPWAPRWQDFRRAIDFRGARVLELGCNMGLLSTFALVDAGAATAHGVDADGRILEANRMVQEGFGVKYSTEQLSFDDPRPWENELAAFHPTIVTALSVLNWLRDKQRFVRFLGQFDTVLFEGHDATAVETARLRGVGFTSVDLVSMSERGRPVLLARK